jgi:hypothetical protein
MRASFALASKRRSLLAHGARLPGVVLIVEGLVLMTAPLMLVLIGLPHWLAWLVPLAVAVGFVVWWLHERQAQGDTQPGLIAATGVVAVVFSSLGAAIGTMMVRRRNESTR